MKKRLLAFAMIIILVIGSVSVIADDYSSDEIISIEEMYVDQSCVSYDTEIIDEIIGIDTFSDDYAGSDEYVEDGDFLEEISSVADVNTESKADIFSDANSYYYESEEDDQELYEIAEEYSADMDIIIDEASFPDDVFRAYILDTVDINNDGILSEDERLSVYEINVNNGLHVYVGESDTISRISSLKGVELFENLQILRCTSNHISSLDISNNGQLQELECGGNPLYTLDVSNNTLLWRLSCSSCRLEELILGNNDSLVRLDCGINHLNYLDLEGLPNLQNLNCCGNYILDLDVSNNNSLSVLNCWACDNLQFLELGEQPFLTSITAYGTKVDTLNISGCDFLLAEYQTLVRSVSEDGTYYEYRSPSYGYCLALNVDTVIVIGNEEPEEKEDIVDVESATIHGDFYFDSLFKHGNMGYSFDYNDEYLFDDSHLYDLTKMSIRVAMAAYGCKENGIEYSKANIERLMGDLRFTRPAIEYPEPSYDPVDSIGSAIGMKNVICDDGKKRTIIMLAVRGGGYEIEWGGNLKVGNDGDHLGFSNAAQIVKKRLKRFINDNKKYIHDDFVIWISGYSRGAATANLVAAALDDGFINNVKTENVKAFCFECPQNTTNSNSHNERYNNIINIVNPADFVTKVAMRRWNFRRYGISYNLPSAETTIRYYGLLPKLFNEYEKIGVYKTNGVVIPGEYYDLSVIQGSAIDMICDALGTLISRKFYVDKLQKKMMDSAASSLGKSSDAGGFLNSMIEVLSSYLKESNVTWRLITSRVNGVKYAHFAELCLAWLDSLDSFSQMTREESTIYRKVLYNCPVDVTVYDENGNIVGMIKDNQIDYSANSMPMWVDDDDQKVVILPPDAKFEIQINATDNGTFSYTACEYYPYTGMTESLTSYREIPIEKDQVLISEIPKTNASYTGQTEYSLSKDGNELTPNLQVYGNDVSEYHIAVSANGNGTVIGGGVYTVGQYAKVTAVPNEGASFLGWYVGNSLLSSEQEYRFYVDSDKDLLGKFSATSDKSEEQRESNPQTEPAKPTPKSATKSANTLTVKVKSPTIKASKLKKKARAIKAGKAFAVSGAQGAVTYKKTGGSKQLSISSAGKITVAKGTKKGTYKIKVAVTAAGNDKYNAATKTVTVKVTVK